MSEETKVSDVHKRLAGVIPYKPSYFRQTTIDASSGTVAHTYQKSFLPYLVGEYAKLGVMRIAISADDPTADYLNELSDRIRSRVMLVDKDEKVLKRTEAFMAPILDEIPVRFLWGQGEYFPETKRPHDPAVKSVVTMGIALRRILLGSQYKLQVDLDLDKTKQALLFLSNTLRSQDAVINTNTFLGLLDSYKPLIVNSFQFVSDYEEDRARQFEQLLDDELYRRLSEQGYYLGFRGKVRKALREIQRIAERIVLTREKPLLKMVATPINAVSGGLIDASVVGELLPERARFVPPIVKFSTAHLEAQSRFHEREKPTEPNSVGKLFIPPNQPVFRDLESIMKAAREILGAKLVTHYEHKKGGEDVEDNESGESEG